MDKSLNARQEKQDAQHKYAPRQTRESQGRDEAMLSCRCELGRGGGRRDCVQRPLQEARTCACCARASSRAQGRGREVPGGGDVIPAAEGVRGAAVRGS